MERGIIIVGFGERTKQVESMVRNIRHFVTYPIHIYTDQNRFEKITQALPAVKVVEVDSSLWKEHPRWGVRQGNYWQAKGALRADFDSVMCLDDDMRIVNKGFVDGFTLALRFGICVPLNPRIYVKYNAMGADSTEQDRRDISGFPHYAPACNLSPMFVSTKDDRARKLLMAYIVELENGVHRGTLAIWKASWKTGVSLVYLPEQWCVCASNAQYIKKYRKVLQGKVVDIEPMILHWGQPEVQNAFKELESEWTEET